MKIQCSCGAKFSFDVTPEMVRTPIQFVCQSCGLDNSQVVNQLIRNELGQEAAPAPAPAPVATPARPTVRVQAHVVTTPAPAPATEPVAAAVPCFRHPRQESTHRCLVCQKPICPQCMEQFGFVCSPFCKTKAENQGMVIPVYAQQKNLVEARQWRKVGRITVSLAAVVAVMLGAWFWYAWFGSKPKVVYSARFPEAARAGHVRRAGPDQIVFLHGGRLARHDLKLKQEVWSVDLIDRQNLTNQVAIAIGQLQKARDRYLAEAEDPRPFKVPTPEELADTMLRVAAESLSLHVAGQNIWVGSQGKITKHDWQDGKGSTQIPLGVSYAATRRKGDELLLTVESNARHKVLKRINLLTGEATTEEILKPQTPTQLAAANATISSGASRSAAAGTNRLVNRTVATALAASQPKPLDPTKIAEQAQGASLPGLLALPATLSAAMNQERLLAELNGTTRTSNLDAAGFDDVDSSPGLIATADGYAQFEVKLLERKLVQREAMKAAPKDSVLNATTSVTSTRAVANELLNEMQRNRGSTVTEDQSRYQVTVRRTGQDVPAWTAEVVGPPGFFALRTVDVITAGTTAIVLDHQNKKLWEAKLNFPVPGSTAEFDDTPGPNGAGPIVERGDTLFICDQGVISAFELRTGTVRWRLPSVGNFGLLFDKAGMMYVNTTSANPESIKYSKQIDIGNPAETTILKVDPKTGKTLWQLRNHGHISHLEGKFIFTVDVDEGSDPDASGLLTTTGLEMPPHLRIRRLAASDGRILWEHFQSRCPLDMQINGNTIELLFKKEVQHLKFLTL